MLIEVINSDEKVSQEWYLKRVYDWFLKQQIAVGLVGLEEQSKETDFLNPKQVEERR